MKYKIIFSIFILILLILALLFCAFLVLAFVQKETNPIGIVMAMPKVVFTSEIKYVSGNYLARNTTNFINGMERQGYDFVEQFGAGIDFIKDGEKYMSVGHMFSSHFMIFTKPQKVSEVKTNPQ